MTRILADDDKREDYPLYDGLFAYFPAALLEIARWSKVGNDKHNPGEALHWAREKSTDHENKILRHLLDAREELPGGFVEATALAWRSLALLQTILEERGMASGPNGIWLKDKNEESNSAQGVQSKSPREKFIEETQASEGPLESGLVLPALFRALPGEIKA